MRLLSGLTWAAAHNPSEAASPWQNALMGLTTPNPVGIRGTYAPIDTSDSGLGPKDDVAHPFRFAALRYRSVSN